MEENTIDERIERVLLGCVFQLGMCIAPILSAAAAAAIKTFSSPLFKSSFTTTTIHYLGYITPLQHLILVLSLCISIIVLFFPFGKSKNAVLLKDAPIHLIRGADGYEVCSKENTKVLPCDDKVGSGLLLHLTAIGGTTRRLCNLTVYCTIGITLAAFWMMMNMNEVLHYVFLLSMIGLIMSYARTIFINANSSLSREDIAWFISIDNNLSPAPMDNKIDGPEQQGDIELPTTKTMVELKGRIWKLFAGCSLHLGMCVQALVNAVHSYSSGFFINYSTTVTSILTVLVGLSICFTFISYLFYLHKKMKAIVVKLDSPDVEYKFRWNKATFGRDLLRVLKVVFLFDQAEMRPMMWPVEVLINWACLISFGGVILWNTSYDLYYILVTNSTIGLSIYYRWVYHSFTKFHNKSVSSYKDGSISVH